MHIPLVAGSSWIAIKNICGYEYEHAVMRFAGGSDYKYTYVQATSAKIVLGCLFDGGRIEDNSREDFMEEFYYECGQNKI